MNDDLHSATSLVNGHSFPSSSRNEKTTDDTLEASSFLQPFSNTSPSGSSRQQPQTKYQQLLGVIEEIGKDIRSTYAGSKSSAERLKRGIVHARILVRECLMETERNART